MKKKNNELYNEEKHEAYIMIVNQSTGNSHVVYGEEALDSYIASTLNDNDLKLKIYELKEIAEIERKV